MLIKNVLDHGYVELLDCMGDDLSIVNAARVSFNTESSPDTDGSLADKDKNLIYYLAKHNHWTPFGQASLKFRIKMPIFVARQMMRSNIGIVWNEVSRRYIDSKPEFYFPDLWRKKPDKNKKQGSGEHLSDETSEMLSIWYSYKTSLLSDMYDILLNNYEVAPELARMVLPQSTYTEVIGTFSLAAAARVCLLREDSHAQWEIQQYAKAIKEMAFKKFPISMKALMDNNQVDICELQQKLNKQGVFMDEDVLKLVINTAGIKEILGER